MRADSNDPWPAACARSGFAALMDEVHPARRAPDPHPRWPPPSNGCVERVHQTILEACYRRTFARGLVSRFTALRQDLAAFLPDDNHDRAHNGRHNPAEVLGAAKMWPPRPAR